MFDEALMYLVKICIDHLEKCGYVKSVSIQVDNDKAGRLYEHFD